MGEVIDFNLIRTAQIPDELILGDCSIEKFSQNLNGFMVARGFSNQKPVWFKFGQVANGKFLPYETDGAEPEAILEAFCVMRESKFFPGISLFLCQAVDSAQELRGA